MESWSQTQPDQMPFRSTRSRFPWTNNNNQGGRPSETKDCQIPRKSQISTIQKSTSTIHWIPKLLPKLYIQIGRTTHPVLPTTQNN